MYDKKKQEYMSKKIKKAFNYTNIDHFTAKAILIDKISQKLQDQHFDAT